MLRHWVSTRFGIVMAAVLAVALQFAGAGNSFAVQPDEILKDAALEQRARKLSAGLRCLVCQNQSIDDSDAPLAKDLRVLVRERLTAGDSDAQVLDYVVARYGDFVLLKPPFNAHTLLLWILPVFVFIGAVVVVRRTLMRPAARAAGTPALSAREQEQLDRMLRDEDGASR